MRRLSFGRGRGLAILAATPALADTCIRQNDIWNWSSINDKTVDLGKLSSPEVSGEADRHLLGLQISRDDS